MLLANFATLATALFTGAAVYISLVEHPARLLCPTAHSVEQWRPSYQRATVMQASLAVAGALLAIAAWLAGAGLVWLLAGLVLGLYLSVANLAPRGEVGGEREPEFGWGVRARD